MPTSADDFPLCTAYEGYLASNNYLAQQLRSRINVNWKFTYNVPMSLMAHFTRNPRLFLQDPLVKWWTSGITPITIGYTILNTKLHPDIERDHEYGMINSTPPKRGDRKKRPPIYFGQFDPTLSEKVDLRVSLSSTELSDDAQQKLVKTVGKNERKFFYWSSPAVIILAVNQLLHPAATNEPKAYLAATIAVALRIWHLETPQLDSQQRAQEWDATIKLLAAAKRPLIDGKTFGQNLVKVCSEFAAKGDDEYAGFDDEVEEDYNAPVGGYIEAAFKEIREFTISNHRRRSSASAPLSPTSKRQRVVASSPARSLAKSRFHPQARSQF